MKDYCDLSIKNNNTIKEAVDYLHGVVCVMNRFHQSAQSQAIYEMFIAVHYRHWNKKLLFDFISDLMILTEDNSSYHKMLYHVRNQVQTIEEELIELEPYPEG